MTLSGNAESVLAADKRIGIYTRAVEDLLHGNYAVELPTQPSDEIGRLGLALQHLADEVESVNLQNKQLDYITQQINSGLLLDDILQYVYDAFKEIIPYDRIGFSVIEDDGTCLNVRARWAKSALPNVRLQVGYFAPLAGSSLEEIMRTGKPRIINDLQAYAQCKPSSQSTQLVLREGIRSSLTCPLIVNGHPTGFMFFSSAMPGTYAEVHVDLFTRIAGQLSVILEKGYLVSDILQQRAEIERQNEELRRANDLKNTFLGIAAHDLRNPLGNIRLAAEILLNDTFKLPEQVRHEILTDVAQQVSYMVSLLNDLLDVSHIESGKLKLEIRAIDVGNFLNETVERHNRLASPKGTKINLNDVLPGSAAADPMRLRQVLDNLISNAVKYSPPASEIQVRAACSESHWRIEIEDQGPGISAKDRQRLFQDFARLSAMPTGGEQSTGLGLSITRRVVEAHHGEIGVESDPGQGAVFWFTVPAA